MIPTLAGLSYCIFAFQSDLCRGPGFDKGLLYHLECFGRNEEQTSVISLWRHFVSCINAVIHPSLPQPLQVVKRDNMRPVLVQFAHEDGTTKDRLKCATSCSLGRITQEFHSTSGAPWLHNWTVFMMLAPNLHNGNFANQNLWSYLLPSWHLTSDRVSRQPCQSPLSFAKTKVMKLSVLLLV